MKKLLTVPEAAARLGLSASHTRLLVRTGKLQGQRAGRDWLVDSDSLQLLIRKPVGRPAKKKTKKS